MKEISKKKDLQIFGFIWTFIFFLVAYLNRENDILLLIFSIFSIISLTLTIFKEKYLIGFYKKWIIFGGFIGRINSKIILFFLFYLIITPMSFIFKIFGKDLLNKKIDKKRDSYWIDREIQPTSMSNQF